MAGNYRGGDFVPENVKEMAISNMFLRLPSNVVIELSPTSDGTTRFMVNRIDFGSAEVDGGYLDHKINFRQAFGNDRYNDAIGWRIANKKPHGDAQSHPANSKFIPLFIFEKVKSLQDKQGNDIPTKGIAFWIEPDTKNL